MLMLEDKIMEHPWLGEQNLSLGVSRNWLFCPFPVTNLGQCYLITSPQQQNTDPAKPYKVGIR